MRFSWIVFLFFTTCLFAAEAKFIRYPAPSPDGSQICFSYQGDLWMVSREGGHAVRLTVNPGYDFKPVWAHDGTRIAFISDRDSNDQIYSMKPDGSDIKQHTYYPGGNILYTWTMDNKALIFGSKRDDRYAWMPEVYMVGLDGKTPQKLFNFNAIDGVCPGDRHEFFFVNGYSHKWRKRYRGAANNDIYSYRPQEKEFTRYTEFDGNDLYPMPTDKGLYFVSDRDGLFNVYYMDFETKDVKQITDVQTDGIRHAAISADGSTISYTNYLGAFVLDTATGKSTELTIEVNEDTPFTKLEYKDFGSRLSEMAISPDETESIINYHGELYAVKLDDKETGRITRITETAWNDDNPVWSKDAKSVYFLSDREGQSDVYMVEPTENLPFHLNHYFKLTRITETAQDETKLQISPDGKFLSYQRGNGDLVIRNVKDKTELELLKGWNLEDYSWSPDSQWIAFSRDDHNFNTDVFIIPAKGGQEVNISQHPDVDFHPVWSPDGKMLSFSSRRYSNDMEVMYVYLQQADDNKTRDDWKLEKELAALKKEKAKKEEKSDEKDKKKKKKNKKETTEPKKPEDQVTVSIDFKDIYKRLHRLSNHLGDAIPQAFTPEDGDFIYSLSMDGQTDLFIRSLDDPKPKEMTKGDTSPRFIQVGKKQFYFLKKGGSIESLNYKGKDKKSYKVKGVFSQKKSEETRQVFSEVWRVQNSHFYDPKFHGADWNQIRKDYALKLDAIRSERDFSDLMNMMIGELNSSHQRYVGPREKTVDYGNLGIQVVPVENGVKITDILAKGPVTKSPTPAKVGDIITEIDRKPFENFNEPLREQVGKRVEFTLDREGQTIHSWIRPGGHREVTNELAYDAWIEANRKIVHEKTDGHLGYVHIKAMGIPSLEDFESDLYSEAEGKDALVIDVRYNGGGWTTDFLLSILTTPEHAYTIPRNGEKGYPQGRRTFYHWTKPIYVLCNQFSYSNAEIFSHAIKTLKRGTLIGWPTFGAVISTGGTGLLNGGFIRMPFRGWYVKGSGLNQELNGAIPDYKVPLTPDDEINGRDPQLDKAIELFQQK